MQQRREHPSVESSDDHSDDSVDNRAAKSDKMFAIMPQPPIFQDSTALFRPAAPSPLSSSPIRASSPREDDYTRDVKSSPIRAPKFKFASRPVRQAPVAQKREVAQEARRKLFLKNVRQRADDQKWERRGGEQEVFGPYVNWRHQAY